jgi:tetratricopeptide (TPR) repeat protein
MRKIKLQRFNKLYWGRRVMSLRKYLLHGQRYLILFLALLLLISITTSLSLETRTITIKVAADREFKNQEWILNVMWILNIKRLVADASRCFENNFGIRFKIKEFEYWSSDCATKSMPGLLNDLRKKVPQGKCDIVLGFTSRYHLRGPLTGVANYFLGYILIKDSPSDAITNKSLKHELCHLFGAADLHEKGSIMYSENPGYKWDEFTKKIIVINRNRSFNSHKFPLPKDKLDEIIDLFKRREKLHQGEEDLNIYLASLYLEKKDLKSATDECHKALKKNPNSQVVHNLLGVILRSREQMENAIKEYQKALTYQQESPEVHYNLGIAYTKNGRIDLAIAEYKKAIELDSRYAQAYANLGHIYLKKKMVKQAIEECRKALKIFPESADALCTLGAAHILKGELDEAEAVILRALEVNPHLEEVHNNLAAIYLMKGRVEDAVRECSKAIAINPDYARAYSNLGYAYFKKGWMKEAEQACSKAISIEPSLREPYYLLVYVFSKQGKKIEAGKAYHKLAEICFNQKTYSLSREFLKRAEDLGIKVNPQFKQRLDLSLAKED